MNITSRLTPARRSGFTLVELLVAAAVSVIIMAILATAFQSGIDTMRQMRSTAGLQDQLRAATEMIRRDLQGNHFVSRDLLGNNQIQQISGAKLSAQWMNDANWVPPLGGFFHMESSSNWTTNEGSDPDGLSSARSNNPTATTGFLIHFTSVLAGDSPQNTYSANTSAGVLSSPAAEVAYFLDYTQPSGSTGSANLYRLIRRQRLVAMSGVEQTGDFAGVSAADQGVVAMATAPTPKVYTLADLANPANRLGGGPPTPNWPLRTPNGTDTHLSVMNNGAHLGDDVLLSNVISFTVQATWDVFPAQPFTDLKGNIVNSDFPFDYLNHSNAAKNTHFDTGYSSAPTTPVWATVLPGGNNSANRIRVKSLQIRLRIYDPQLKSTRQTTIVQDM